MSKCLMKGGRKGRIGGVKGTKEGSRQRCRRKGGRKESGMTVGPE